MQKPKLELRTRSLRVRVSVWCLCTLMSTLTDGEPCSMGALRVGESLDVALVAKAVNRLETVKQLTG